jgi:nicotinamide-nucleotide amidase
MTEQGDPAPATAGDAARVVAALSERGLTLAVAESLTGGMVMAAITEVPGASAVLRGGPVVYATDTKSTALDVDADLLNAMGPVDPEVASAMASSVRQLWQADIGLATTGVAGPDPQAGHPPGEVYVAVSDAQGSVVHRFDLAAEGGRGSIRERTVGLALAAVLEHVGLAREGSVGLRGYTGGTPDNGDNVSDPTPETVSGPDRKERR